MAQRATSLGPKPSVCFGFCFLFVVVSFVCFFGFCFFCFCFLGGFKGQVRWPKGPPHLALNPPSLFFVFFVFFIVCFVFLGFLCLFFICFLIGKPCFSPSKGNFCLFICVSLCFSFALFGPPPFFPFLFLCLSLVIIFLPSFLFSSLFLVLSFYFCLVCFLVQDVMLFFFFCLLSSFVLNHHVWFIFALYLVFFFLLVLVFVAFLFCNFLNFGYLSTNISENIGNCKKKQKWKMHKKKIFWQEQSAQVCSQIVFFFLFCVSLNFALFAENTIK